MLRVLHTADWHLGKTLGDLDRTEEYRLFLQWLERVIVREGVDIVLIAGDLFDGATPPQSAVALYFDFLAALREKSRTQVVLTAGNHDSPAQLEAPRDLLRLARTHVSASLPAPLLLLPDPENPQLAIAPLPYLRERDLRCGKIGETASAIALALREGITRVYAEAAEEARPWVERGVPALAMGHLTALGARTSESERDIHIGGLGAIGADAFPATFAYIALGHLHRPQSVGGRETLRYAGSPLPLSFGEAGDTKEVRILEFEGACLRSQRSLPVPLPRPLLRLKTAWNQLDAALEALRLPSSPLEPWVEAVITDLPATVSGATLYETLQEKVKGKPYTVVRVQAERGEGRLLEGEEAADPAQIRDLLANPAEVFSRRLESESLSSQEREKLRLAFTRLCALHEEQVSGKE